MCNTTKKRLRNLETLELRNMLAAHLLGDLNDTPIQVDASNLTVLDDAVLFSTDDGLWRIDAETERVDFLVNVPIEPRAASMVLGNKLLWLGEDDDLGGEIWMSDGTTAGTQLLRDINPGTSAGVTDAWVDGSLLMGGEIYFAADSGNGFGIWKTDGTTEGTIPVYETSENETLDPDQHLVELNGEVYFETRIQDSNGPTIFNLKKTNGIDAVVVKAGDPNSFARIILLASTSQFVFFRIGADLWRTDGSQAGNLDMGQRADIGVAANESLFFSHRGQLWTTDGSIDSTKKISQDCGCRMIRDTPSVGGRILLERLGADFVELVFVDLLSLDVETYEREVLLERWYLAPSDVVLTPPIWPVNENQFAFGQLPLNDFNAERPTFDIYLSNGTADGTTPLPESVDPRFTAAGKQFFVKDGIWVTDALENAPRRLPIDTGMTESSPLRWDSFRVINGITFFAVGNALWSTDGTEAGTELVREWTNVEFVDFIGQPRDGHAFLRVQIPRTFPDRLEIWSTDGTSENTRILDGKVNPDSQFAVVENRLIVNSPTPLFSEVYAMSITGETEVLARFDKHPRESYSTRLFSIGKELIFIVGKRSEATPSQVWATDGTAAGTRKLFDEESGYYLSLENGVWRDGDPGSAFWGDGVDSELIQRIAGPGQARFSPAQVSGRVAYVLENDRRQIWISDGPGLTSQFTLPPGSSFSRFLSSTGDDTLYFMVSVNRASDLWATDGTIEGTRLVAESTSVSSDNTVIGNELFFRSETGDRELWKTDGTPEGTQQVLDIYAGEQSSYPRGLTANGSKLYFAAETERGLEPWVYQAEESFLPGDADGDHEVSFGDFLVLSANFGNVDATFADGDFDGDGSIGFADFLILSANFGQQRILVPDLD